MRGMPVNDELIWVEALELALDFQGAWRWEVIPAPPFPLLVAEAADAPLALEIYPLDPERFPNARAVAQDLVQSRFGRLGAEEIVGGEQAATVEAEGEEGGRTTRLYAQITLAHDAYYVLAFSGPPAALASEQWRLEAMLGSATFGRHRAHGRGVRGLINLMESRLSESDVPVGYSRSQRGVVQGRGIAHNLGPFKKRKPHFTERGATWLGEKITGRPEGPRTVQTGRAPVDALSAQLPLDDLDDFEARLARPESRPLPSAQAEELDSFDAALRVTGPAPDALRWPLPWEPVGNGDASRGQRAAAPRGPGLRALGRSNRELEIAALCEELGADVAWYAERVYGVGVDPAGYRDAEPFPVVGLDRVALLLEASLRIAQGELDPAAALPLGPPRRAWSPLGRQIPEGRGVPLSVALEAMIQGDDATAAELVGWAVGWREVQERLPALGLNHHTLLIPSRARALAFTDLAGPLEGLELESRVDLWRTLSEEERRSTIGQLHKAHLETDLRTLGEAYLAAMQSEATPLEIKARWSLALGPRGTAREYAQLMARLHRGEVLSPAVSAHALGLLKPCLGDPLSPAIFGVDLVAGKLGQDVGSLSVAGVLGRIDGGEVAVCVLLKNIKVMDYAVLVERLHTLGRFIYQLMTEP